LTAREVSARICQTTIRFTHWWQLEIPMTDD
jgi:hypothetical protein